MKMTYFKYWLKSRDHRVRADLYPMLLAFTRIDSRRFRESFRTESGDNLFLFHIDDRVFLFIVARDDELIKTISANALSHEDIQERLRQGEHVGFASYVYVGPRSYGLASTFHGPKNKRWTDFVNAVLHRADVRNHSFQSEPLPTSITTGEAMRFAFKGKTMLKVDCRNWLAQRILGLVAKDADASTIDIIIRPSRGEPMPHVFNALIEKIGNVGVKKFVVSAKDDVADTMQDYYIVGSGHVTDSFDAVGDSQIARQMAAHATNNQALRAAIAEFEDDEDYTDDVVPALARLGNVDRWPDNLLDA